MQTLTSNLLIVDLHCNKKRRHCQAAPPNLFLSLLSAEVPVQQALQSAAVTGFVLSHLMHGVMNGIQAQLLGLLGQLHLALAGAALGIHTGSQVLLGTLI